MGYVLIAACVALLFALYMWEQSAKRAGRLMKLFERIAPGSSEDVMLGEQRLFSQEVLEVSRALARKNGDEQDFDDADKAWAAADHQIAAACSSIRSKVAHAQELQLA